MTSRNPFQPNFFSDTNGKQIQYECLEILSLTSVAYIALNEN